MATPLRQLLLDPFRMITRYGFLILLLLFLTHFRTEFLFIFITKHDKKVFLEKMKAIFSSFKVWTAKIIINKAK